MTPSWDVKGSERVGPRKEELHRIAVGAAGNGGPYRDPIIDELTLGVLTPIPSLRASRAEN